MQDLNTIPSVGTFGEVARNANTNFSLLKIAVDLLEHSIEHSRGYFTSASALTTAFPSPVVGDWAIVEVSGTPTIYKCSTRGTWSNSGTQWAGGSVDLTEYAQKAEMNNGFSDINKALSLEVTGYSLYNFCILATGKWNTNNSYKHGAIAVQEGEKFLIKRITGSVRFAYAQSNTFSSGSDIDIVSGTTIVEIPTNGMEVIATIPAGCNYLLFNAGSYYTVEIWRYHERITSGDTPTLKDNRNISSDGVFRELYNARQTDGKERRLTAMAPVQRLSISGGKFVDNTDSWSFVNYIPCKRGEYLEVEFTPTASAVSANTGMYVLFCEGIPSNGLAYKTLYSKSGNTMSAGAMYTAQVVIPDDGFLCIKFVKGTSSTNLYWSKLRLFRYYDFNKTDGYLYEKGIIPNFTTGKCLSVNGTVFNVNSTSMGVTDYLDISQYSWLILRNLLATNSELEDTVSGSVFYDESKTPIGVASYIQAQRNIESGLYGTILVPVPSEAKYIRIVANSESTKTFSAYYKRKVNAETEILNPTAIEKSFKLVNNALSVSTGLYPSSSNYVLTRSHTPRFIKLRGDTVIVTQGLYFNVLYYDKEQSFIEYITMNTDEGPATLTPPAGAKFFRISLVRANTGFSSAITIKGVWTGDDEVFQKLPADSGYQNVTFAVDVNICPSPSKVVSEFVQQYTKSINSGVLHLPSSYKDVGAPTPLIIFLHGTAGRFTPSSTRFGSDNPYAPEWDAAGYAQLDVDMIPELYGYTATGSAGTDDDCECVEAAYEWVIEHFNIARDGVYLIGRSRGGQAVMQILGKYNPAKLPVIAAVSNSGANTIMTYLFYRTNNTSALWNLFCDSHGLPAEGRPTFSSGLFFNNENVRNFLRDNIDIWWNKAMTGFPMMVVNPTEYQSREEIFDLISDSYRASTERGKAFSQFVRQCKFRSPVPLRFDWCKQDPTQQWDNSPWNYSLAVKDTFCSNPTGNAIYREWPTSPEDPNPTAHFHELLNFLDGDFKLPSGTVITNPSMARLEWLLWCQRHDRRFKGIVNPVVVE